MKRSFLAAGAAALLTITAAGAASAYDIDPTTGVGFVGKGEVQLALGWNNKQLQDNAGALTFTYESSMVTEVSWICTNENNEHTQPRERTTTTTISGLVESVARERNQITGFILSGFDDDVDVRAGETEGPAVNSCPSGPWVLTTPAGDPEVVELTGGGLFVTFNGATVPLTVSDPA